MNLSMLDDAAGIHRAIAAHRSTSRCPDRGRAKPWHLWTLDMDEALTERPASTAKLEVPLPQEFPLAFQRMVDARNRAATGDRKRIFARDLYEEAISELIHLASNGRITFIATPFRDFVRKMFWVDQTVKAGVEHLALAHGITRSAVVVTAFQLYLDRHGALQDTHRADMVGP